MKIKQTNKENVGINDHNFPGYQHGDGINLSEAIARNTNSVDSRAVALLNSVRGRSDATTVFSVSSFARTTKLLGHGMVIGLPLFIPLLSTKKWGCV